MEQKYIHGVTEKEQSRLSNLNKITNESFVEYLEISDSFKICDFGCGLGNLINEIYTKYNNAHITGVEISKEQYEVAKKNNKKNKNVVLINEDVLKSNLPDNCFDITYCRYLLEHVQDPVNVIKEMIRITRPGGKIVVQENDLHNVIYYPEIQGHSKVMNKFCELQIQMGGDPYIGRKLFSLFNAGNAKNIKLDYSPEIYTEEKPQEFSSWMSNSLNILMGAKAELIKRELVEEELFNNMCKEMQQRILEPKGVALFHWNRLKVIK